jgi:penicillin amidase
MRFAAAQNRNIARTTSGRHDGGAYFDQTIVFIGIEQQSASSRRHQPEGVMSAAYPVRNRALSILFALSTFAVCGTTVYADTFSAPGLSAPGSVDYDTLGIPTITAVTDNDAAFLQGYVQAKARFFEMDFDRRAASGTVAELVGQAALASDVQTRTIGLRRAALASWQAMDDGMRGWLQAYANGVNYWLQTSASLPPEYGALSLTRVEAWTPVDTVVIGKALAFQLSFDSAKVQSTINYGAYQQAAAAAHVDPAALYFGDTHRFAPPDTTITIPNFLPSASTTADTNTIAKALVAPAVQIDAQTLKLAQAWRDQIVNNAFIAPTLRSHGERAGSNEFAVSGSVTASGKPIIANDPHLTLALPPIFMEMHIVTHDPAYAAPLNATGVSVPGAPGIIQGCNTNICWGTTVNPMDVTDYFKETFRINSYGLPTAIVHNGQDEPVQWEFQSFYVNQMLQGQTDVVARDNSIGYLNGAITVIVPRRNNGPVVQIDGTSGLSIAFTGWGPTMELKAFRQINRAQNLADFQTALTYFDFGSQNFAYADTAGNIAYFTSAENPIRQDLQQDGGPGGGIPPWLIRDGSGALHHDWLAVQHPQPNQATPYEIMPASEMPHVINPASGYFANANNDPIGTSLDNNPLNQLRPGGGIYYLNYSYSVYRVTRINQLLSAMIAAGHKITPTDIQQVQLNNQPADAELVRPYLLGAFHNARGSSWAQLAQLGADPAVSEAIARVTAWNLSTPTGIQQGFDAGDNPAAQPQPSQSEQDNSVAATLFYTWRSNAIKNIEDATLTRLGLAAYLPGDEDAWTSVKFLLDAFPALGGNGASGVNFFAVTGAPDAASARDYLLLKSLKDSLTQLSGSAFAPAFGNSTTLADYRWGKLHRFVLVHPLGGPFNIPGANPYPFTDLAPNLPGISRDSGYETVNPGGGRLRVSGVNDFMFSGSTAPGRRFVGEMATPISAVEVIPGGESAVLGDPHYADQLPLWLTGQYHALPVGSGN